LFAEPLRLAGEDDRKLDLGLVGHVIDINVKLLNTLCADGTIPVMASIARDKAGGKLNVNADSAAGKVAAGLQAEKLVVVSDTHGIRTNVEDPDSWVSSLNEMQIKEMIDAGIITDAMLPKVEACLTALDAGVKKAHIIDGRIAHSLLLEIYTDKGIGTQIVRNPS
jgi:acetylglutamate kinase